MPPKQQGRLSLVERQQALLESKGFSAAPPPSTSSFSSSYSSDFRARPEAHLVRHGQANAASSSRIAVDFSVTDDLDEPLEDAGGGGGVGDGRSVAGSTSSHYSHAPSIHPSLSGLSVASSCCSTVSIGAGDETAYWKYRHRSAERSDLGHTCRECKGPFTSLGEPLTERRGARTSSRYHGICFSGFADPRSQAGGSAWAGRLAGTQLAAAPREPARKMRTNTHFADGGGNTVRFNPKVVMGNFDFKDRDGVGGGVGRNAGGALMNVLEEDLEGFDLEEEDKPQIGNSGLNANLLAMHNKNMEQVQKPR